MEIGTPVNSVRPGSPSGQSCPIRREFAEFPTCSISGHIQAANHLGWSGKACGLARHAVSKRVQTNRWCLPAVYNISDKKAGRINETVFLLTKEPLIIAGRKTDR
jgi:hypothetical protein